ncbi:Imm51 family immunity protein [Ferruginibacter yonginensis]|uniref:Imm51 family immunity protein n=1 Tax=Ferruginibacter yonginensis TaxID=1310416 RepID=A0ABV8QUM9_9BACT
MQKVLIGLTIIISCLTQSCISQTGDKSKGNHEEINKQVPLNSKQLPTESPRISKLYDSTKIEKFDPFIIYKDGSYMVAAEIESKELFEKYNPIFEKYEYSGNGYSWEGHIKQMLQKENPSLLKHLQFDPEAGDFYVFADSEKTQREFADLISKIFKNLPKLEQYLKTANREQIDD